MLTELAPVALFAYRRPSHFQQTLSALSKNDLASETELFVFSDGAKKRSELADVDEVRRCARSIEGFRSVKVIERAHNLGLARSIINGVNVVCREYGRVIVVEDDLLTHIDFLTFMNHALAHYQDNRRIFSISGFGFSLNHAPSYSYDAFCSYRSSSWGWATWNDRWVMADWDVSDYPSFCTDESRQKLFNRGGEDLTRMLHLQMMGKLDSWAIRWAYTHFQRDALALYPVRSRVYNIGFDGSGVHCRREVLDQSALPGDKQSVYRFPTEVETCPYLDMQIQRICRPSLARRAVHVIQDRLAKIS